MFLGATPSTFRMGMSKLPTDAQPNEGCLSVRKSSEGEGLTDEQKLRFGHVICALKPVEKSFRKEYIESGWGWQMFGDQGAGMFAILPGRDKSKEQCTGSYDPSSSRSKRVVI